MDELLDLLEVIFYDGYWRVEFIFNIDIFNYVLDYFGFIKVFSVVGFNVF